VGVTRLWPCELTLKHVLFALFERKYSFFPFFPTLHRGGACSVLTLYRGIVYIRVYGDQPGKPTGDVIMKKTLSRGTLYWGFTVFAFSSLQFSNLHSHEIPFTFLCSRDVVMCP
jgi:hypothetical protein